MTKRQLTLLRFIQGYQEAKGGVSPTFREMGEAVANGSKGNAHRLFCCLEEQGWVRSLPFRDQAIQVLQPVPIPRDPDGHPLYFVEVRQL